MNTSSDNAKSRRAADGGDERENRTQRRVRQIRICIGIQILLAIHMLVASRADRGLIPGFLLPIRDYLWKPVNLTVLFLPIPPIIVIILAMRSSMSDKQKGYAIVASLLLTVGGCYCTLPLAQ